MYSDKIQKHIMRVIAKDTSLQSKKQRQKLNLNGWGGRRRGRKSRSRDAGSRARSISRWKWRIPMCRWGFYGFSSKRLWRRWWPRTTHSIIATVAAKIINIIIFIRNKTSRTPRIPSYFFKTRRSCRPLLPPRVLHIRLFP